MGNPPVLRWFAALLCGILGVLALICVYYAVVQSYESANTKAFEEHPWYSEYERIHDFLKENKNARIVTGFEPNCNLKPEEQIQFLGYDLTKRTSNYGPSRQIIEAHGLSNLRHLMGLSCFFFAGPFFLYTRMSGLVRFDLYQAHKLACFFGFYMATQTVLSVCGDYLCCEDDSTNDFAHQWFNFVDNIFAFPCVILQLLSGFVYVYHGNTPWSMYCAFCSVSVALVCKLVGAQGHNKMFWDTCPQSWTFTPTHNIPGACNWTCNDYRNSFDFMLPDRQKLQTTHIFYSYFYHILWHVFSALAATLHTYSLLKYPLV